MRPMACRSYFDFGPDLAQEGSPLKLHQAYALRRVFSESDLPMWMDMVLAKDLPRVGDIRAWPIRFMMPALAKA